MSLQEEHFFVGNVDYCELGKAMSDNLFYRSLMISRALVCVVGIALCGLLLSSKINSVIMHVHARILLKYHIFITMVLSLNYLIISSLELYRLGRNVPSCEYTMPRWLSFSPHFITSTIIHCQILSCMCITIERLVCTLRIRTYENANHGRLLVAGLFVLTLAVFLVSYAVLGLTADWKIRLFYFSFRDTTNHYYGSANVFAQFGGDLITLILCKIVDVMNHNTRRKFVNGLIGFKHHNNQLSSKLQIRENIVLSTVLMPIICVHFVITAFSALVIFVVMMTLRHNILVSVMIAEFCSFFPFYGIVLPVLIFRRHPSLFWKLAERVCKRNLRKINVPAQKSGTAEFDHHFKWFDKMMDYKRVPVCAV